jgi:hypothetical protein
MSEDKIGYTPCYICKAPLAPLVSICWTCGYSQLPNPETGEPVKGAAQGGSAGNAPPTEKLKSDLQARRDQARADLKARLKKT